MADLAGFRTYADARGNSAPSSATDALATEALQRASDYITYHYVNYFLSGYDATSDGVDEAIYEAAILELATPNFFSKTYTPSQIKVLTQVDTIKWTPAGTDDPDAQSPKSNRIEAILDRYMGTRKKGGFVLRSVGFQNV